MINQVKPPISLPVYQIWPSSPEWQPPNPGIDDQIAKTPIHPPINHIWPSSPEWQTLNPGIHDHTGKTPIIPPVYQIWPSASEQGEINNNFMRDFHQWQFWLQWIFRSACPANFHQTCKSHAICQRSQKICFQIYIWRNLRSIDLPSVSGSQF